jgi:L,D-transpeptidase ErfK/SrfK
MFFQIATKCLFFFLLLAIALPSDSTADLIVGGETTYAAQRGDCLSLIGAKFGVDWQLVARLNNYDAKRACKTGQQFSINNRRIVAKIIENGIIINIPDRMLYYFKEGEIASAIPVGLGLPGAEWQTPTKPFSIVRKEANPKWVVPKSIQREMERKHQPIIETMPPGPDNPLGRFALYTSIPGILIHETIWPTTIYQWRSHGCIRVSPDAMPALFDQIEKGTTGEIIYEPVSVAEEDGVIFLQVSRDIYRRLPSLEQEVKERLATRGFTDRVDWAKVQKAVQQKTGIAEDVTK